MIITFLVLFKKMLPDLIHITQFWGGIGMQRLTTGTATVT
jgi:hypothetical protein